MNKYDPHWNYRRCFREIDEIIWGYINSTLPGDRERYKESAVKIADRTKKIITAYVDEHAAMMIELISKGRFDEFPLPRLPLPNEGADHSDSGIRPQHPSGAGKTERKRRVRWISTRKRHR